MRSLRLPAVIAATVLGLAGSLTTATSAAAAEIGNLYKCTDDQRKEFATTGLNTSFSIELCVEQDSPTQAGRADAVIEWRNGGPGKLNDFEFHLRLEKYDVVVRGVVCDYTDEIATRTGYAMVCQVPWVHGIKWGGVTADATVKYDLADDGIGFMEWDLGGTSSM